jgi:hypothetical protein
MKTKKTARRDSGNKRQHGGTTKGENRKDNKGGTTKGKKTKNKKNKT